MRIYNPSTGIRVARGSQVLIDGLKIDRVEECGVSIEARPLNDHAPLLQIQRGLIQGVFHVPEDIPWTPEVLARIF